MDELPRIVTVMFHLALYALESTHYSFAAHCSFKPMLSRTNAIKIDKHCFHPVVCYFQVKYSPAICCSGNCLGQVVEHTTPGFEPRDHPCCIPRSFGIYFLKLFNLSKLFQNALKIKR